MHWTGKASAWLLVPLVLLAMVFTAKLVKVRNSWTKKIEDSKKAYNDVAPKVVEAQALLDQAKGDWHRQTVTWGSITSSPERGYFPFFVAPTNVSNAAAGTLTVALGSQQGIQQNLWLHGFEVRPDGTSVYRGDFVATTVREGESLMQPNWRIRPGDTAGWQGGNWRWRVMLPSAYPNRFEDLEQTLVRRDERHAERQQTLAGQQKLIAGATEQLKLREAELVGGPELPMDETLDAEFRDGLTATLETLEEERNGELVQIDRLRRSVRELSRRIQAVQSRNRALVEQLPQPAATGELTQKP
jgi:hypothetical protein